MIHAEILGLHGSFPWKQVQVRILLRDICIDSVATLLSRFCGWAYRAYVMYTLVLLSEYCEGKTKQIW